MTSRSQETIIIYGAQTYLGREIACYGRALGHQILCVTKAPPTLTEPWMHGVRWATDSPGSPPQRIFSQTPPTAVIYCATSLYDTFEEILLDRPLRLLNAAKELPRQPRFIYRSTAAQPLLPGAFTEYSRQFESHLASSGLSYAALRFPLLFGTERPDSVAAMLLLRALSWTNLTSRPPAIPVETTALATLRVTLEPEHSGIIAASKIASLGDIMIAQGAVT